MHERPNLSPMPCAHLLVSAALLLLSVPLYAATSKSDLSDKEILAEYGNRTNGPAQRAALEVWKKEIARSRSLPMEEAVPLLAKCVREVSFYFEFQVKERHAVLEEARAVLNAIPGHAEYYARKINAERQQVIDGKLDWKTYNREREDSFRMLVVMRTINSVRVQLHFLDDLKGHYTDDLFPGQDNRCSNAGDAAANLQEIIGRPKELEYEPDIRKHATYWKAWWQDVEAGKTTFRFKDSPVEYNAKGQVAAAKEEATGPDLYQKETQIAENFLKEKGRTAPRIYAAAMLSMNETYVQELSLRRDDPTAMTILAKRGDPEATQQLLALTPKNAFVELLSLHAIYPDHTEEGEKPDPAFLKALKSHLLLASTKTEYRAHVAEIEDALFDLSFRLTGDVRQAWFRAAGVAGGPGQYGCEIYGNREDLEWIIFIRDLIRQEKSSAKRAELVCALMKFADTAQGGRDLPRIGSYASSIRANVAKALDTDQERKQCGLSETQMKMLSKPEYDKIDGRAQYFSQILPVATEEEVAEMNGFYKEKGLPAAQMYLIGRINKEEHLRRIQANHKTAK